MTRGVYKSRVWINSTFEGRMFLHYLSPRILAAKGFFLVEVMFVSGSNLMARNVFISPLDQYIAT